ncbi:MAG: MerR family transcriptional regulator, partial [Eubacteriales bacterium]|nr:MerR family transcriptional regulator [Eubacteriales bacterium]
MEDMYTVGEVSEITGIEKRKLKYYIERGIIVPSCKKSEGGKSYWLYSKDDIMKIRQIALYKELGYSNSKIHKMLSDPDFDFVEDLYKRIDSMKTERRQMENRIYVAEMIRYFYETEEDQARLDISDFGNDIDGEVEGMFSGFLTELENDTSTPESGGLNINDNEALADRVNSLLEKYDSLRRAMRAPADSGELEHYIEEMTADFNS